MVIHRHKYPRTFHLPWSESVGSDDKVLKSTDFFHGKQIVVTTKMDGENTSLYSDYIHARSLDSRHHPSRTWIKNFHSKMKHNIPDGYRICGENLYAVHSIYYTNLASFFYGFSIWDDKNYCLCYTDTKEWFELLDIIHIPVLFEGIYDEDIIKQIDVEYEEGYVIRLTDSFHYNDFKYSVAKYVKKSFKVSDKHWMHGEILLNKLQKFLITTEVYKKHK